MNLIPPLLLVEARREIYPLIDKHLRKLPKNPDGTINFLRVLWAGSIPATYSIFCDGKALYSPLKKKNQITIATLPGTPNNQSKIGTPTFP